jgi:hypothetical protein
MTPRGPAVHSIPGLGRGAGERDRTADLPFTRRPLCQLSYTGGDVPMLADPGPDMRTCGYGRTSSAWRVALGSGDTCPGAGVGLPSTRRLLTQLSYLRRASEGGTDPALSDESPASTVRNRTLEYGGVLQLSCDHYQGRGGPDSAARPRSRRPA